MKKYILFIKKSIFKELNFNRFIDRFNFRKVTEAVLASQLILFGVYSPYEYMSEKESDKMCCRVNYGNWKFYKGLKRTKK